MQEHPDKHRIERTLFQCPTWRNSNLAFLNHPVHPDFLIRRNQDRNLNQPHTSHHIHRILREIMTQNFVSRLLANDERRCHCSTRIFALSTRPIWHGVCSAAKAMAQSQTMIGILIAVWFIVSFPHDVKAQPSTAPPSSLSMLPL